MTGEGVASTATAGLAAGVAAGFTATSGGGASLAVTRIACKGNSALHIGQQTVASNASPLGIVTGCPQFRHFAMTDIESPEELTAASV